LALQVGPRDVEKVIVHADEARHDRAARAGRAPACRRACDAAVADRPDAITNDQYVAIVDRRRARAVDDAHATEQYAGAEILT
jgi:hypothetical protein